MSNRGAVWYSQAVPLYFPRTRGAGTVTPQPFVCLRGCLRMCEFFKLDHYLIYSEPITAH